MWKKLEALKHTDYKIAHNDAYNRVVSTLERSLENEKQYNALEEKRQILLEKSEREHEILRNTIRKHHFTVLQRQIEEKKRSKLIEENEVVKEKELTDEVFRPKKSSIKDQLDAQMEEKMRAKRELMEKEAILDRMHLEMARKSLESEMRRKSEGRQNMRNQLRESWEMTQITNKLQKAIERTRRFGDNFIVYSEDEDEDNEKYQEYRKQVKKRHERLFGKGRNRRGDEDIEVKEVGEEDGGFLRKRSKSMISKGSKFSQRTILEKINKLSEQEDTIKKEKKSILNFLESKTQSKVSSRPMTVATLMMPRGIQLNASL
ncbi:hypothetical protein SteCoe_11174 [Stentor coeruleus]|uniref:Trichohyalin-plectin-homology domain-containing protein n=1 Tax=Stentor coeruleus TaxID=5963 RepID=A0A1R2CDT6_9CILI|nr:hypothetical protein SteCoe_11174 [Stentor coeruleus]